MYEEEDEEVVRDALKHLNAEQQEWRLERVAPELRRRGLLCEGLTQEETECLVRCEVGDGMGQGFFVCVFRHEEREAMGEEERKVKERVFEEEMRVAKEVKVKTKEEKKENVNTKEVKAKEKKKAKEKDTKPIDYITKIKHKHGKHIPLGTSCSLLCSIKQDTSSMIATPSPENNTNQKDKSTPRGEGGSPLSSEALRERSGSRSRSYPTRRTSSALRLK